MTRMPRAMVDGFLREYLGAEVVSGRSMKVLCGFYTGMMVEEEDQVVLEEKKIAMEGDAVAFSGSLEFPQHPLAHCCKVLKTYIFFLHMKLIACIYLCCTLIGSHYFTKRRAS